MKLETVYPLPQKKYPIRIIGAGSIVKDAHLPAYRMAGFDVEGIADLDTEKAGELAKAYDIPKVFASIDEAIAGAPEDVIWDMPLPANLFVPFLEKLPDGSSVLLQKPMGEDMDEANAVLGLCRRKKLKAAVNLQLRFAPFVMAARSLIEQGVIGDLYDMEVRVTVNTPWGHFENLKRVPRMEITYHSIHHIDIIRSFLGNPQGVYAKSIKHPSLPEMKESCSSIILDYGNKVRANVQTNHFHLYGERHQESYIKWEGSKGAIKAKMGLLMNYPDGVPDCLEYSVLDSEGQPAPWEEIKVEGTWFPEAFIGSMSQVMRAKSGEIDVIPTSVEDTIYTMACVEAAYASSDQGGVAVEQYIGK